MCKKNSEIAQKPINTGTLRFLVYATIATHPRPITISEIEKEIAETGYQISHRTIHNFINEALAAADFYSEITLQSHIIHAGAKSRARAFYFSPNPQNKKIKS